MIPDISNKKFPEARKLEDEQGLHRIMYHWSPKDYNELAKVWKGPHPEDGSELIVVDDIPEGFPIPDLEEEPQLNAPDGGMDPEFLQDVAKRISR
ncbi:MAG: manganese catalase family protein [Pyrinomonadaceae bacterium]